MVKIIFICVLTTVQIAVLNAQNADFGDFISYFPEKQLPYLKNNFTKDITKLIPANLALKYLCGNDSSFLTFNVVGRNQETLEVKYHKLKPFDYRGYAKIRSSNYILLVYDGYTDDGYHEFTTIIKLGLYSNKGQFLDEMLFYVFDDTGKLKEQTANITNDYKIQIFQKDYIKNEKGRYTSSYYRVTTTYDIDNISNKFKEISSTKELLDKSK